MQTLINDFFSLMCVLWKRKILILAMIIIGAGCGFFFSISSPPSYTASNIYKAMTTQDRASLIKQKLFDPMQNAYFIAQKINKKNITDAVKEITPKGNVRTILESDDPRAALTAKVVGFRVSFTSPYPNISSKVVDAAGEMFDDGLLYANIRHALDALAESAQLQYFQLDAEASALQSTLEVLQEKKTEFTALAKQYGDAGLFVTQQPEQLHKMAERYLGPKLQLVAIETDIVETRGRLEEKKREQRLQAHIKQLIGQIKNETAEVYTGYQLLDTSKKLTMTFADNKNPQIRQAAAMITQTMQEEQSQLINFGFITGTPLPTKADSSSRKKSLPLGIAVGAFFGIIAALFTEGIRNRMSDAA